MTYQEALTSLTRLILSYPQIRQTGSQEEIQTLRDEISECLYHFGDTYAYIRANSDRAETSYKTCVDEKKLKRRKEYNNKNVGLADVEAVLDCKDALELMHQRNEDYYRAKSLVEQTELILNSLSSRLKINSRHE